MLIPLYVICNGIQIKVTALADTGANVGVVVDPKFAQLLRDKLGATRAPLNHTIPLETFHGDQTQSASHVTRFSLLINDRFFPQVPCVEIPSGGEPITLGRIWLEEHHIDVSPWQRRLIFPKELPPRTFAIPNIEINYGDFCSQNMVHTSPSVEADIRRRDQLMEKEDRKLRAERRSQPPTTHTYPTFAAEQRASKQKMIRALRGIENSPPPSLDRRRKRLPVPKDVSPAFINAVAFRRLAIRSHRDPQSEVQLCALTLSELDKVIEEKRDPLPQDSDELRQMVSEKLPPEYSRRYTPLFSKHASEVLAKHRPGRDHKITLNTDLPADQVLHPSPLYQMSLEHLEFLKEYLTDRLHRGWIVPSVAPFASPVLFAKKPGGGWRFCVDYRKLNNLTRKDHYPIPLIDETLTRLSRAKIFTKLDIRQAFNRIRMDPASEELTTFRTRYGSYKYKVLPFGLCNGPATFQRYINEVLYDLLDECCTAYIDDILIYSEDPLEHATHVKKVMDRLMAANLQVDIKKSEFHVTTTKFLGFIISTKGIRPDPEKVEAITNWEPPTSVKGVQSFLGFCNFYRRFINGYSRLAKPLFQLTAKGTQWTWNHAEQGAFDALKNTLASTPLLAMYDPARETRVETDASDGVVGGVMSQRSPTDGNWHPIAYFSKTMLPAETRYEIHDKEMLAVVRCMLAWTAELQGLEQPFTVFTDHRALEYFSTKRKLNSRQIGWSDDLSRFNYQIAYRPGTENAAADALTRKREDLRTQKAIKEADRHFVLIPDSRIVSHKSPSLSIVDASLQNPDPPKTPDLPPPEPVDSYVLIEKILCANREAPDALLLRTKAGQEGWAIQSDLLTRHGKLYVPEQGNLRTRLLQLVHCTKLTAHPGRRKTLALMSARYYWPGMVRFIEQFRRNCQCVASKVPHDKTPGLLHPLPIPSRRWQHISVDFHSLPPDQAGFNMVLVVIDRLSKRAFSIACRDTVTAEKAAWLYWHHCFRTCGIPESITSDRGPQFISQFMDELGKILGIKQKLSTADHAQTDGNTEIYNQYLNQRLIPFLNHHQDNWGELLPAMDFAQAILEHESLGMSPWELEYGEPPHLPFDWSNRTTGRLLVKERLNREQAQAMTRRLHDAITWAVKNIRDSQERMTTQANKHRREPDFDVGDWVWVVKPNWATDRPSVKLDWRRRGPFQIMERKGYSYRLALPSDVKVHPVFPADKLRKAPRDPVPGQDFERPPPVVVDGELEYEVEEILAARVHYGKLQYRAQWKGWDPDPKWYPASDFKNAARLIRRYHDARVTDPGPPVNLEAWLSAAEEGTEAPDHPDDDKPMRTGPPTILRRPQRR